MSGYWNSRLWSHWPAALWLALNTTRKAKPSASSMTSPPTPRGDPMPEKTLPPGVLPYITDTDPPPLHPATVVDTENGVVYVDERKLHLPKHHNKEEHHHGHEEAPQRHR